MYVFKTNHLEFLEEVHLFYVRKLFGATKLAWSISGYQPCIEDTNGLLVVWKNGKNKQLKNNLAFLDLILNVCKKFTSGKSKENNKFQVKYQKYTYSKGRYVISKIDG